MHTAENGLCWLSMFRNPAVVSGFPILCRPHEVEGLEMTPSIMAALLKSIRVVDFRGATFIKSFPSMLAATSVVSGMVLWHHFFDPEGGYMACSGPRVLLPSPKTTVGIGSIQESQHVVGWCESVKNSVGAPGANYNIRVVCT
ncbi:hypothetical protein B0T14DRAFT_232082 [Immersiella caudata]|uniref:Uncharacterized protein n=1 Tax=Immersiella caudata TaxID=314043 RepID=A0AA40C043_9PEZI|nr:hypothetical protein B0T14DRAFT_232082 [Immersiella caudata]